MKIESYEFGNIIINGKTYTEDLILFPDKIKEKWIRDDGHFLQLKDLEGVFEINPSIIIIGSGDNGMMKVSNEVYQKIEQAGIKIVVDKTKQACDIYNSLSEKQKKSAVLALHLTC